MAEKKQYVATPILAQLGCRGALPHAENYTCRVRHRSPAGPRPQAATGQERLASDAGRRRRRRSANRSAMSFHLMRK